LFVDLKQEETMTAYGDSTGHKCSFIAVVLMFGVLTFSASAQKPVGDWARIERIADATPLIIQTDKSKRLFGRFKSANDSTIIVQQEKGDVSIDRQSIQKVYLAIHKKKNEGRLLSILTFFGVGRLLALVDERISPDSPTILPVFGAAAAAVLVQEELTKGFKKGSLIYRIK
jgi:hypothetical protein